MGHPEVTLRSSWVILGSFWLILGSSWGYNGLSAVILGHPGIILGHLGGILGCPWSSQIFLESSWVILGHHRVIPGSWQGHPEVILGSSLVILGHPGIVLHGIERNFCQNWFPLVFYHYGYNGGLGIILRPSVFKIFTHYLIHVHLFSKNEMQIH